MDARLQRRVQRYGWDKAADHYERYWTAQLAPARGAMLRAAALAPGERVLDVACGTGLVTFDAALRVGPAGAVVGTDLSERMVVAAREQATLRRLDAVRFERMDAEALDLPDASFDVALSALGILYCPDPLQACRELFRVLEPGGRVALAVWGERKRCGWAEVFPIVEARVASEVCPLFFQLGTGDTLALNLETAGFGSIKTERIGAVLEYPSPADALGAAFAGGPVALAYSRFDDPTRDSAHAEYLASIEPYRDGEGYRIPGEFVVASAVRP
ncbi:MAG: methyltransferase domain-containing protein [Gemmatimonadales bacterium]